MWSFPDTLGGDLSITCIIIGLLVESACVYQCVPPVLLVFLAWARCRVFAVWRMDMAPKNQVLGSCITGLCGSKGISLWCVVWITLNNQV